MFKDHDHTKQIYKLKINRKEENYLLLYFIFLWFFVFYYIMTIFVQKKKYILVRGSKLCKV